MIASRQGELIVLGGDINQFMGNTGQSDNQHYCCGPGIARVTLGITFMNFTQPNSTDHLTPRESEVIGQVALGLSNKVLARNLGIAPKTVNAHLEKIFRKLQVSNRTAAAMKAQSFGLI
ncbi:MAG: hypothetical protein COA42_14750 [Alteromonadaceae bacterium]|nr:MAG: hypothetical protein COA42_14750 [Alteromonadaceae bacterium]